MGDRFLASGYKERADLEDLVGCDRWIKNIGTEKIYSLIRAGGRYGNALDNSHEPARLKKGRT
jgi:hypothetical protein